MAADPPMIEAVDCAGALGVIVHQRPPARGKALAAMILNAAREQTPHLVHPDAHIPG